MPYVNVVTNSKVSKESEKTLIDLLGNGITVITNKSPERLFIRIEGDSNLYCGGKNDVPNAMVSVDLFGYATNEDLDKYAKVVAMTLDKELGVKDGQLFINFTECRHWASRGKCNTAYEV